MLRARLKVRHHDDDDEDSDYEDSDEERGPPPLTLAQAADALARVVAARRADLGDACDSVAYAGRFLEHLAAFDRPAPDASGSFVALACGHNAPWRRKERDALYAWLGVQLPPSS